jgi:hypothetical protein
MACNLSTGRTEPCKQYIGGIDELYLMRWSDIDYASVIGISSISLTPPIFTKKGGGNLSAFKFDLKGINSFESTSTVSHETAGVVFDQSITVTLKGLDDSSSDLFYDIITDKTVAFVKDRNSNNAYFFGSFNGMTNNGVFSSGQAAADLNGVTFTLTGQERHQYKVLEDANSYILSTKNIVVSTSQVTPTV